jgi:hypothetical protein
MQTSDALLFIRKYALFLLMILLEIVYLLVSFLPIMPLFRAVLAFPCLYIIPGFVLLVALGRIRENSVKLVVVGFFISTLLMVILASLLLALRLAQIPFFYSLVMVLLVVPLSLFNILQRRELHTKQTDLVLVAFALLLYIPLLLYFSQLPRFLAPDETAYLSHALLGILDIGVPPAQNQVMPSTSGLMTLLLGRYFWIHFLLAFVASTGLPMLDAGLVSVFFLVMIALMSSLLIENKWLRLATFGVVLLNPLLIVFSASALNDLAIVFYAVFAALLFVNAFKKTNAGVTISTTNLFFAVISVIVIALVKINILIIAGMWLILVAVLVRYQLYKVSVKYKLLLIATVLPVLLYELCLDIPYVISQRVLGNPLLAGFFENFLFISPASTIVDWLFPFSVGPATTVFARKPIAYFEYFYTLLSPEMIGVLFSAVILVLPILIISTYHHQEFKTTLLATLVIISFYLYYFYALLIVVPSDINRYSLWMIPLWIPLTFRVLQDIKHNPRIMYLLQVVLGMLAVLALNLHIVNEEGGVLVGYALQYRFWTTGVLVIQLLVFTLTFSLSVLPKAPFNLKVPFSKFQGLSKSIDLKTLALILVLITLVFNSTFFNTLSMRNSLLYSEHGLVEINEELDGALKGRNLIFANNYIYMRPYVNAELFGEGFLLPPPESKEEFLSMLQATPNNSLILISDDHHTTWYEYANTYIKQYTYVDFITPEVSNMTDLTNLNLTTPNLFMSFDDANETTVLDDSVYENHGQNHGAEPVAGLIGNALDFNGTGWVSIPGLNQPNQSISISFFARFNTPEPTTNQIIISKGYAPLTGSYTVFLYAGWIYFSLGGVGSHGIRAAPYLGSWHHYIFTYDGEKMEISVDGSPMGSKPVNGTIRESAFDLEIGRDSEHQGDHFIGQIDSLQISNNPLNHSAMIEQFFSYYASRIDTLLLPTGQSGIFRVFREVQGEHSSVNVTEATISVDDSHSVQIGVHAVSTTEENITLLMAAERFTKVYTTPLMAGQNYVELEFDYISDPIWRETGGPYWRHLSQVRLIVLENNTIIHNVLLFIHNPKHMNALLVAAFLGILVSCIVILLIKQKRIAALRTSRLLQ